MPSLIQRWQSSHDSLVDDGDNDDDAVLVDREDLEDGVVRLKERLLVPVLAAEAVGVGVLGVWGVGLRILVVIDVVVVVVVVDTVTVGGALGVPILGAL
jgi:hypothetical protein